MDKSEQRLIGYVVPRNRTLEASELTSYLAQRLPAYMVPSRFVNITAIPLSANGKVDRAALPAPAFVRETLVTYDPPIGPTETMIARIWCQELGIEKIGRRQRFFELGGHSLLAVHVCARMQRELGVEISPALIFEHSTIAGIAAFLEDNAAGKSRMVGWRREQSAALKSVIGRRKAVWNSDLVK